MYIERSELAHQQNDLIGLRNHLSMMYVINHANHPCPTLERHSFDVHFSCTYTLITRSLDRFLGTSHVLQICFLQWSIHPVLRRLTSVEINFVSNYRHVHLSEALTSYIGHAYFNEACLFCRHINLSGRSIHLACLFQWSVDCASGIFIPVKSSLCTSGSIRKLGLCTQDNYLRLISVMSL